MPRPEQIQQAIRNVTDQRSFIDGLLHQTLNWPIDLDFENIGDISYEWTDDELNAAGLSRSILTGPVLQMQSLIQNQPWGIFILEFTNPDALITGRGLTGPLRKVLRGLVPKRRGGRSNLPNWERENLLFICTHNYQHFRFAYFKPAKQKGQAEPLAIFGWDSGDAALRTLCEYNLPFLVWSDNLQQPQWRDAFNVEKVTKGFYSQVAKLFTDLVGGSRKQGGKTYQGKNLLILPGGQSDTVRKEFAVRLIGRLVFCWFLKKKKSEDGLPLVPEELLSTKSINNKGIGGYYHSILEPLFFEVLNTPEDKRNKQFKKAPWSIIPFLNGGLFTPHEDDFYKLTFNGISEHLNDLIIPDDLIRELFEVFETYNFTIEESTPLDIEVAVDPEILGRIFENLLAEINPETGETARKATGSYYTPRPIVEYMVDESLKQYLITKTNLPEEKISLLLSYGEEDTVLTEAEKDAVLDALDKIKIIDPACGSGAFPMGILQKILLVLRKIDPDSRKWLGRKLSRIDDAIFKKDLERKLKRESLEYVHKLGIIRDAIYGVDIQPIAVEIAKLRCFLSLIVDETIDDMQPNRGVEPLPNLEFKFVCANTLIGLPKQDKQQTMFEDKDLISELKNLRDEYLNSYGREKKTIEERFRKVQSRMFEHTLNWGGKETQTSKLSQWDPFSLESNLWFDPKWMFGIENGFDIVIGNPPYGFRNILSKKEKEYFRKVEHVEFSSGNSAELFSKKCFDRILIQDGVLTFIIPKKSLYGESWENFRLAYWKKYELLFLLDTGKAFEEVLLEQNAYCLRKALQRNQVQLSYFNNKTKEIIHFSDTSKNSIFMDNNTVQIYVKYYHKSVLNKIQKTKSKQTLVNGNLGLGIGTPYFSKEKTNYKLLKGIDIERWKVRSHRYLKNEDKLNWGKAKMFLRPKIIAQVLVAHIENPIPHLKITVAMDNEGMIIVNTLTAFNLDDCIAEKFWLAYMNSKFVSWYAYNFIYSRAIRTMHLYDFYIKQIPVPDISIEDQQPFIDLVDRILVKKEKGEDAVVEESEIDQMVYKLYGLTEEEIAIVKGQNKTD